MKYRVIMECSKCDFERAYIIDGLQDKRVLQPAEKHNKETGHIVTTEFRTIRETVQ